MAPAGTPDAIVRKISEQVAKTVRVPDIAANLSGQGADPVGSTPEEFGRYMRNETEKWAKIVKAANIKLD